MRLSKKDYLILLQNLTARATELGILKYGKEVTIVHIDTILGELLESIFKRLESAGMKSINALAETYFEPGAGYKQVESTYKKPETTPRKNQNQDGDKNGWLY